MPEGNSGRLRPESLPARFSFESDVLAKHLDQLQPTVFRCDGYFLDIGIPQDFDRAQVELRDLNRGTLG